MQIDISTSFEGVQRRLDQLREDIAARALASAVNRTIDQGKTEATRQITKEFAVPASYVRERLFVKRATFRRGQFDISAELTASGKRRGSRAANLIAFMEKSITFAARRRAVKAGQGGTHTLRNGGQIAKALELRFKINRGSPAKSIPGAFIGNKGRTVFIRTGKARLPIKALQTVDVPQMFNARRVNKVIVDTLLERFPVIFEREVEFYVQRFNRGGAA